MNLDKIKIDKSEIYFQFLKKSGRDFDIEKLIEIFGLPEKSFSKNPLDYYVKDLSEAFNGSIDESSSNLFNNYKKTKKFLFQNHIIANMDSIQKIKKFLPISLNQILEKKNFFMMINPVNLFYYWILMKL